MGMPYIPVPQGWEPDPKKLAIFFLILFSIPVLIVATLVLIDTFAPCWIFNRIDCKGKIMSDDIQIFDPTKPVARLEKWYVGDNDALCGEVYGHPRLPDGSPVQTSRMVLLDLANNRALTKNTNYILGKPKDRA